MQSHQAANIFPMEEQTIDSLAADIEANGLHFPIETLDGKIIDGRRRYRACVKAGVTPTYREIKTDDPIKYVLSLNLHRRQLTPSQRAMVGARAREMYDAAAKERMAAGGGDKKSKQKSGVENLPHPIPDASKARDAAGKSVGVSGKYVDHASKVLKHAIPEVVAAVDEGRMNVTTAALLAGETAETQLKEVTNPKRRRTYNSVSNAVAADSPEETEQPAPDSKPTLKGVGVIRANEAINCLIRIPKNDALRKRGFQVVTDWIKANK